MTVTSPALTGPHQHLEAQIRWRTIEIVFWLATLLPFVVTPNYLVLASQIAITALFALSLDLILGYAGIVSLGHAAFFGFGAYTAGLISKWGWGEPLTGLVGCWLRRRPARLSDELRHLALPASRADHDHARLRASCCSKPPTARAGSPAAPTACRACTCGRCSACSEFDLYGYTAYWYALIVLFLFFLVSPAADQFAVRAVASRHPRERGPHARRSAPRAARTSARSTPSPRSWRVSPGAILTQTTETVSLGVLDFQRSADILVMLILGGTGRLYGGLIGAIIYMIARDQFSGVNPQYWYFPIGVLLIAVVLFLPNGILGGLAQLMNTERGQRWFGWLTSPPRGSRQS